MNRDFVDLLRALSDAEARFLVVGAFAVGRMGVAPGRIDVLTSLTAVEFEPAWSGRELGKLGGMSIPFIGRGDLIRNKRALGRPRDLADASELEGE